MSFRFAHETADQPVTVLVVGGTTRISEALTSLQIEGEELSVSPVDTAAEAVTRLEADSDVGIVVSATVLPDWTGRTLLEQVREMDPDLPFVLVGTDVSAVEERDAIAAGVTEVVRFGTDPAVEDVLRARVKRALEPTGMWHGPGEPQFQALVEAVSDVIVVVDTDSVIRYANASVADIFGYTPEEVVGESLPRLMPDDEAHRHLAPVDDAVETDELTLNREYVELRGRHRDGRDLDIGVSIGGFVCRGDHYSVGVVRDISRRKQRERELEAESAQLERLGHITDMLLRIERVITRADTRERLERGVCEELADTEGILFAWIGAVGDHPERLEALGQAGRDRGYLDAIGRTLTEPDEPAVRTAHSRTHTVENDISAGGDKGQEPWREHALARGFESVLSVPLLNEERLFGVLSVYASTPGAFDEFTEQVFEDVGDAVAHGLGAFERKRALMADTVTDLDLELPVGSDLFGRVARTVGTTVELEGIIPRDESLLAFLLVSGADASVVKSSLEAETAVSSVTRRDRDESVLFKVVLQGTSLVTRLVEQGATLRKIIADSDSTRVLVTLPVDADVRQFIETLERTYPGISLQSRSQRDRSAGETHRFRTAFEQSVTDRQLQALRTAYLSGYFEWPREHTAEEVAELLDITQPTLNRHLRVAERTLLTLLLDADESQ
ncbi:bacterio-opsin activator domain-containing protein [Halorientalis salina]|uniref:bacterio-opsin activator domain-containing protein n=1 Tax=Halorientalis salina TaxID=2932266 RepID=UPI0010AB7273|nr:bacterio-opsin activator domain-containing protein [Halorientalis salina]